MENKNTIKIHTSIQPENEAVKKEAPIASKPKIKKIRRRPSAAERLYKNTAVACALLLCVMALKNIDTPVTNAITDTLKSAVSMDLNLSESVGRLSFVQKMMPESALVFLNLSESNAPDLPVSGTVAHPYTADQPWTEYLTENHAPVYAILDGTVEACVQTDEGDWTILISHEGGAKSVYAFIGEPLVKTGSAVRKADKIALTGANERARLYLEYRENSLPADPKKVVGE